MKQQTTDIIHPENQYPNLKRLDHTDHKTITYYTEKYNRLSCEFSFPSLYLWNEIYHYKLSFINDWLLVFDTLYDYILMPMGEGITPQGLLTLSISLKQDGYSGDISNVPPEFIERHPELSHHYDIENERGLAEYIYSTEKLHALRGRKLRKKKNHISRFLRHYPNYQVEPMNATVRMDCLAMVENMLASMLVGNQAVSESIRQETIAIKRAFNAFDKIPLEGIAIYIESKTGNKLVCFSIYSRLNKDVFTIHFEKVDYSYQGAAQIINWETAKILKDKCKYINREQDLGIPGLRKAKLSYEPELIYPDIFLSFKGLASTSIAGTAGI